MLKYNSKKENKNVSGKVYQVKEVKTVDRLRQMEIPESPGQPSASPLTAESKQMKKGKGRGKKDKIEAESQCNFTVQVDKNPKRGEVTTQTVENGNLDKDSPRSKKIGKMIKCLKDDVNDGKQKVNLNIENILVSVDNPVVQEDDFNSEDKVQIYAPQHEQLGVDDAIYNDSGREMLQSEQIIQANEMVSELPEKYKDIQQDPAFQRLVEKAVERKFQQEKASQLLRNDGRFTPINSNGNAVNVQRKIMSNNKTRVVKSPSDTTIYIPGLTKTGEGGKHSGHGFSCNLLSRMGMGVNNEQINSPVVNKCDRNADDRNREVNKISQFVEGMRLEHREQQ